MTRSIQVCLLSTVACALQVSCASHAARAPSGAPPDSVVVPTTAMTLGFALSPLRSPLTVGAFRITKSPVTVGQYRACVAAGACSVPSLLNNACKGARAVDGPTYSTEKSADSLPLTCATAVQAGAYCEWVGGRLPRLAEWTLAARGVDVHRYAWGDQDPDCTLAPRLSYFTSVRDRCCGSSCASGLVAGAHGHPQGRSPFGLEDVLLTRGELLGPDLDASGRGCLPTGQGCVVSGIEANAIDAIADIPEQSNINPISMMGAIYSFRCAWEGNGT